MNNNDEEDDLISESQLFHLLCNTLLEMFRKAPQNNSKRKIVCGGDENGNVICMFQGNEEDAKALQNFLNSREKL
jgi:hypothetical protein